jgi:hypothetical protein
MSDELDGVRSVGLGMEMFEFLCESESKDSGGEQRDACDDSTTELDAINVRSCDKRGEDG